MNSVVNPLPAAINTKRYSLCMLYTCQHNHRSSSEHWHASDSSLILIICEWLRIRAPFSAAFERLWRFIYLHKFQFFLKEIILNFFFKYGTVLYLNYKFVFGNNHNSFGVNSGKWGWWVSHFLGLKILVSDKWYMWCKFHSSKIILIHLFQ